jgi:hypothetical protein
MCHIPFFQVLQLDKFEHSTETVLVVVDQFIKYQIHASQLQSFMKPCLPNHQAYQPPSIMCASRSNNQAYQPPSMMTLAPLHLSFVHLYLKAPL